MFKPGAAFNQALDMYRFDRHLRLLMFNEIEKIEVAVRSAIVNITSRETSNPFWMTDPTCFYDANTFVKTKQLIDAVDALLSAYPSIDVTAMGFPRGWESEPLWR